MVGWGLGFWATSVVFLFAEAWPNGTWETAPVYVTVLGRIAVPLVFVAGLFMITDANFLGSYLEGLLKRLARMLNDSGSCAYWMMATMLRSAPIIWILYGTLILLFYEFYEAHIQVPVRVGGAKYRFRWWVVGAGFEKGRGGAYICPLLLEDLLHGLDPRTDVSV